MQLLKILFIIILILFPFGELLRFDVTNHIAVKPLDVIVGVAAFIGFIVLSKQKKINWSWTFWGFPLIGLFSLLLNTTWLKPNELLVSSFYLVRYVSYLMLMVITLQFDKNFKKKLGIMLFIDGLLILLAGYLQYFFYNGLKNLFYLGWDEHLHRIFSTFLDPNFAGAFYVLYFFFVGGLLFELVENKTSRLFSFRETRSKNIWIIGLSLILIFTLIAIFLTFSRAALLAFIVGSFVLLTLLNKKRFIFLIVSAVVLFGFIVAPKFNDENMNLFRQASSIGRLDNYGTALQIIHDRPIFGVGFNSYRYTKDLYGLNHDWTNAPSHADAGVDNSFLFVLATTGIVGLVMYGLFWKMILQRQIKRYRKSIGAVVVISSICALFINALFINSLFFAPLMLWMWLLIGVTEEY